MAILSAQSLRDCLYQGAIEPFHERTVFEGMTYGLGPAGYDIRLKEEKWLEPGEFTLGSSIEHFSIPNNIVVFACNKSSLARRGIDAAFSTVLEPGWEGYLTIEIKNHSSDYIYLKAGSPILQLIFHELDEPTDTPYNGKYQNQPDKPVYFIREE